VTRQQALWLNVALFAAVALLAGFGGAWLHTATMVPTSPPSLHDRLHQAIKLSPDQEAKLNVIETAFNAQKATLEADMASANAELAAAMAADKSYTANVQAAIDHFHHAMGELQKATVEHVFAMRAILTPDQALIFDAQVRSALLASGPTGKYGQLKR
jgi:nickel and cobalt resistance protein CnrR